MTKRIKVFWTHQAQDDWKQIRVFIARDAPITASAFVRRLRLSLESLRTFPESGQVVPEIGDPNIREVIRGNYRVVYRIGSGQIDVLTVFHAARLLDEPEF